VNKTLLKSIDFLMKRSESKSGLVAIEKVFAIGIPFNKPHGIRFISLSSYESEMLMKNKRINHNHLGGIHACAIATVGEFSAGLLLCKNFEMSSFRVIMKTINVEYTAQARKSIKAHARVEAVLLDDLKKRIVLDGQAEVDLKTYIEDIDGKKIAVVTTEWQIKNWKNIKTP
jgi:acyl-coenzyme A thioesterase PaaI-like protein